MVWTGGLNNGKHRSLARFVCVRHQICCAFVLYIARLVKRQRNDRSSGFCRIRGDLRVSWPQNGGFDARCRLYPRPTLHGSLSLSFIFSEIFFQKKYSHKK